MLSRRLIFQNNSMAHAFFRCHNKSMLLKPNAIKDYLIELLAKYKAKYRIKIFDFAILDNHVHLFLYAPSSVCLGDFMRTIGALLARRINKVFERDSHVLRERYKSPVVTGYRHCRTLIKYIYANRYKITKTPPNEDYYCSAFWRMSKPYKIIEGSSSPEVISNNRLAKLLDPYIEPSLEADSQSPGFISSLVAEVISDFEALLASEIFCSFHTIGDRASVLIRNELMRAFSRDTGPPILDVGVAAAFSGS